MHKKKKTQIIIISAFVSLFVLIIAPNLTIKKVNHWTCAYTGSRKGNTVWVGIITGGQWNIESPIEKWLQKNNKPITHNWIKTAGTSYGLMGGIGASHSEAPPIYSLALNPELQKQFIQKSTDQEIENFLQLLTSRERKKQEDAVRAIEKKYLSCIFQSNN